MCKNSHNFTKIERSTVQSLLHLELSNFSKMCLLIFYIGIEKNVMIFLLWKNDSEFKTPKNASKWSILRFRKIFGGQKKFLGPKFFFYHIPHDNRNFSIRSNFFIGNFQNLVFLGFRAPRGHSGTLGGQKCACDLIYLPHSPYIINHHFTMRRCIISWRGGGKMTPPPRYPPGIEKGCYPWRVNPSWLTHVL